MKSIGNKLIIFFSIILLIACSTLSIISYTKAAGALNLQSQITLKYKANDIVDIISTWVEGEIEKLEMLAALVDIEEDGLYDTLNTEAKRKGYDYIVFMDLSGIATLQDGTEIDLRHNQYIKDTLKGKSHISDPQIKVEDGKGKKSFIQVSAPVYKDGRIIGALVGQIDGQHLNSLIEGVTFGETGYAYMTDSTGRFIGHRDISLVLDGYNPIIEVAQDETLMDLAKSIERAVSEKTGNGKYLFRGSIRHMGFATIEDTSWIVYTAQEESEVMKGIVSLRNLAVLATVVVLLVGVIITYLLGLSITKPIKETTKFAEMMANLDIQQDIPDAYKKRKDEVGQLANSFQLMISNIREFLQRVVDSTEQVAASSEELTAISQQSTMASELIASSAGEMTQSSIKQLNEVLNVSTSMEEISTSIDEVSSNAKGINQLSKKVLERSQIGKEGIRKAIEQMNNINNSTLRVQESLGDITHSSMHMNEIINVIKGIAEQTNLLALNAAIEAARAGEQGRGFAIVANEVRKLAEESQVSVDKISQLIEENKSNIENANILMVEGSKEVGEGIIIVNDTDQTFNEITNLVGEVSMQIDAIASAILQVATGSQEVVVGANEIQKTSENVASQVQNVSAATEEQTASMEEISSSSENLATLAQELQESINKFKF